MCWPNYELTAPARIRDMTVPPHADLASSESWAAAMCHGLSLRLDHNRREVIESLLLRNELPVGVLERPHDVTCRLIPEGSDEIQGAIDAEVLAIGRHRLDHPIGVEEYEI